jgi:type II secretion system protein N
MPRIIKIIAYLAVFAVSFVLFLYWMFPYDMLKDRVAAAIEEPFGREIEVSIGDIEPYYFTGLAITDLKLSSRTEGEPRPLAEFSKVRVRASFFSLLFGSPRLSFLMKAGKGEIEGSAHQTDEGFVVDFSLDDFDVATFKMIESQWGLKLSGRLDGSVELNVDRTRAVRTSGKVDLTLKDFKLAASQLNIGGADIPLPDTAITKGSSSRIKLVIDKGAVSIDEFKLADGDLGVDVKGKVFLSTVFSNYRLNLTGTFKVSEALSQAIPFLFVAERQKQADGSYPVTITGRIAEPAIKIGTFTLPL